MEIEPVLIPFKVHLCSYEKIDVIYKNDIKVTFKISKDTDTKPTRLNIVKASEIFSQDEESIVCPIVEYKLVDL